MIGIGNPERGDDALGRLVARRLRDYRLLGVKIVECDGEAAELVDLLRRARRAYVVDAAAFGAPAGTVRRIDASGERVPTAASASTHGFGLGQAIELARALGCLPQRCIVYVVEGSKYDIGAPLSPAVAGAVADVTMSILRDLADLLHGDPAL